VGFAALFDLLISDEELDLLFNRGINGPQHNLRRLYSSDC